MGEAMQSRAKIGAFILACVFAWNAPAREISSVKTTLSTKAPKKKGDFAGNLLVQRSQFEDEDAFYKTFVSKTDSQLEKMYNGRWWYHETQVHYGLTATNDEHIDFASTNNFGKGERESDLRSRLAAQALRMRLDAGIRTALAEIKNPSMQKTQKGIQNAMNTMNNYSVGLSNKPGSRAGQFRLGYDVLTDASKVEYVQGVVEAGVYHPHFSGLVAQQQSLSIANLSLGTNFGNTAPKAQLNMPLHQGSVEASLSKPLSDVVTAKLVTGQPFKDQTVEHRYEAQIAYSF